MNYIGRMLNLLALQIVLVILTTSDSWEIWSRVIDLATEYDPSRYYGIYNETDHGLTSKQVKRVLCSWGSFFRQFITADSNCLVFVG